MYRYYNVRIAGPPPAVCSQILDCTDLYLVRKCDNCFYRVRTAQLYINEVHDLFVRCAEQNGYPDADVSVNAGTSCS